MKDLNGYGKWPPVLIVIAAAGFAAFWQWVVRAEVAYYGDPAKSFFSPSRAMEGDEVDLCFFDAGWYRLCPSKLFTELTPAKGPRIDDLPVYDVRVPTKPGRTPPKCRKWTVPVLGPSREAGIATLTGHLKSECWPFDHWTPIITVLPSVKIDIGKRESR